MAEVSADDFILGYDGAEPYLVLIGTTVYDSSGNDNGRLDPGETVDLTATLINIGGADLSNVFTTIESFDPHITISDNYGFFGQLPVDSIKENTDDPYTVSADSSTLHGHDVEFKLVASAGAGFVDTSYFTICVGQPVPSDTGYYYVYYSDGLHAHSPVFEWIAIDSTQTVNQGVSLDLLDNQTVTVDLPFTFRYYNADYNQISISSNGWIAMGDQTDDDWTNSSIPDDDGPQAMVAGLWDDLDPGNDGEPSDIYYYYDEVNHRFIVEYFQVEHWPSGYHETFEIILLDPIYNETPTGDGEIIVQYLVEMQQTNNTLGIENFSEDVGIEYFFNDSYHTFAMPVTEQFALRYTTYAPDVVIGVEEFRPVPLPETSRLMVYPSITTGHVNISYIITDLHPNAKIKIYDVTGRLIKNFNLQPNIYDQKSLVSWDGRDDLGQKVSSGIYFVSLETEDYKETSTMIVIE